MPVRAILLDKDGTILDYARTWIPINREVALFAADGDANIAARLLVAGGHDPMTNSVAPGSPLAAGSLDDIARAFAACLGQPVTSTLTSGIDRIFREGGARHSCLIDGVLPALQCLKNRGFVLGIATNDTEGGLEASLARHSGVLDLCSFLAGCDSGYGAKPEPGMVAAFAAATGIAARDIAVVGDAVHDLEMGHKAGVGLKIAVLSGTGRQADLAPWADVVVDSVCDIPELLAA